MIFMLIGFLFLFLAIAPLFPILFDIGHYIFTASWMNGATWHLVHPIYYVGWIFLWICVACFFFSVSENQS